MMLSKKEAQLRHAVKRAKGRFGLSLNEKDLTQIVKNIQNNKDCAFVKKESNRISQFAVRYRDSDYRVIYDKERKSIVTFLHLRKPIKVYQERLLSKKKLESMKRFEFEKDLKQELSEIWKD